MLVFHDHKAAGDARGYGANASMSENKGGDKAGPFRISRPTPDIITSTRIRAPQSPIGDARRDGRQMPSRADIDPADIRDLLPNIVMIDIEAAVPDPLPAGGHKGGGIQPASISPARYLDELRWDDQRPLHPRLSRWSSRPGVPLYGIDVWPLGRRDDRGAARSSMLPLSSDGAVVDRCLSMEDFLFSQHQMRRHRTG